MTKKIFHLLTSRIVLFGILILLQIVLLVSGVTVLVGYYGYIITLLQVLNLAIIVHMISKRENPMYKMSWILTILLVPFFGGLFYLLFGKHRVSSKINKHLKTYNDMISPELVRRSHLVAQQLKKHDSTHYRQAYFLQHEARALVYQNTYTEFLTPGERKWEVLLEELKKAEHYIFIEYFIVQDGVFFQSVLEILKQKASDGVCVRLIYDDLGSVGISKKQLREWFAQSNIEVQPFNPLRPSLDSFINFRDHRKICVIDGNVAITGGVNLSDEYINIEKNSKRGHWKDSSVLLKGEGVFSLTVLFLQFWQLLDPACQIDYNAYLPTKIYPTDGFVQPFGDNPLDDSLIAEMTYMNIINAAKKYVYIQTPYLILDNEMLTALRVAAQSGVDVRIITPHIPDKRFVHAVTQANYDALVSAGIRVFEYTPGFMHAKVMVSDDQVAVVGTANFDFRSFYLHFECGVCLYHTKSVLDVRNDFLQTQKVSTQIHQQDCCKVQLHSRIWRAVLRVFSPLL